MGYSDRTNRVVKYNCAILTDLDNTIYNWVDYFAPCFRAMVHAISANTGMEESIIVGQFQKVFARYGSVEYPFSVQRLEMCQAMSQDRVNVLAQAARVAFGQTRRKRLVPYPGVRETLMWAKANDIAVIAVSNAPWYLGWRRLWRLGLKGLFAGIAAAPGFQIEDDDLIAETARLKQSGFTPALKWETPEDELKPNPNMYRTVMQALELDAPRTWIIGDSLAKDIGPALAVGAVGIWARYGATYDARNFQTLLAITHWSEEKIRAVYEEEVVPTFVVDSFSELMRIIPGRQRTLWN
jgi:phosphoglycolate phosphatase